MKIRCTHCGNTIEDSLAVGVCPHCGSRIPVPDPSWVREISRVLVTGPGEDAMSRQRRSCSTGREMIPLGEELQSRITGALSRAEHVTEQRRTETPKTASPKTAVPKTAAPKTAPPKTGTGRRQDSAEDPRWLPAGTVIHDRYEIVSGIGGGGFGITYKAWDRQDNVYRAVKEYFQARLVNRQPGQKEVILAVSGREKEFEAGKQRMLDEARIVARFTSPGIVRVNDYFEENNTAYMVMEYIEGRTLQNYLLEKGRCLRPDEVRRIGSNLCEALEEIHRAGVIHRDIAPDNIFLKDDGSVKIIDFGTARLYRDAPADRHAVLKRGYAPPEQYDSEERGGVRQKEWTDVYALGATLYLMMTGQIPVDSKKRLIGREKDPLPEPRSLIPTIPENLNNTIMKAMAVNIQERFQNASEMREALQEQRRVRSLADVRRGQRLIRYALAGTSVAAAVALVLFAMVHYGFRRHREVLPSRTIRVWYSVSTNPETRNRKNAFMETMQENLAASEKFGNVELILTAVPEALYEARLEEAYQQGQMPQLYEMPAAAGRYLYSDQDLSDLPAILQANGYGCTLLTQNPQCLDSGRGAPIGMQIPLLYVNTALGNSDWLEAHSTVGSVVGLDEVCGGDVDVKIAADPRMQDAYSRMFDDFPDYVDAVAGKDRETFTEGNAVVYLGDSSDYFAIRSEVRYELLTVDIRETGGPVICRFDNYWNVRTEDAAEARVTKEVLAYLYSDEMQDLYYLQNTFSGIPLCDNVIGKYPEVQPKFDYMLEDLSLFTFIQEE